MASSFLLLDSGTIPLDSGPLAVVNHRLVRPDGTPVVVVGVTAFSLLSDWLTRPDHATAFVRYATSRGVSVFRAFGMFANPGGIPAALGGTILDPRAHADYWAKLASLEAMVESFGGRLLATALADCQYPPLTALDQQGFLDAWAGTLVPTQAISEGWNEANGNGVNTRLQFVPLPLLSKGSMGGTAQPFSPPGSLAHYETSRDPDFPRTCKDLQDNYQGDNANPPIGVTAHRFLDDACALFVGEPIGIGDADEPGRTTADDWAVWQFYVGCVAFGSVLNVAHLRCGITCDLPAPGSPTERCLDAAVAASHLPLLDFVFAPYVRGNADDTEPRLLLHHHDAGIDGTGASRTYQLGPLVDGRYLVMVFQPEAWWAALWRTPVTVLSAFAWLSHPATVFVVRP
jgi:hypothetical protein